MFKRNRDDRALKPSLPEAWQMLGERLGLEIESDGDESIRASGRLRDRAVTVSIRRDRKWNEPLFDLIPLRRRNRMRETWLTELTMACANPRGVTGVISAYTDLDDPAWDPRNLDQGHCRTVRSDPPSLAAVAVDQSVIDRFALVRSRYDVVVEPAQLRLTIEDTAPLDGGYFLGCTFHCDLPGAIPPWPERALIGPIWWLELFGDIADLIDR